MEKESFGIKLDLQKIKILPRLGKFRASEIDKTNGCDVTRRKLKDSLNILKTHLNLNRAGDFIEWTCDENKKFNPQKAER